jgi:hypothetical protein
VRAQPVRGSLRPRGGSPEQPPDQAHGNQAPSKRPLCQPLIFDPKALPCPVGKLFEGRDAQPQEPRNVGRVPVLEVAQAKSRALRPRQRRHGF